MAEEKKEEPETREAVEDTSPKMQFEVVEQSERYKRGSNCPALVIIMYDYLIVGAGLFGSVFAYEAGKKGKSCLVVEKRDHIGGNIYTEEVEGINVHKYGAHIFHTSDKRIWQYMQQFAEFNRYTNSPVANYKGEIYNLPFNMNTFNKLWGVVTPNEAKDKIQKLSLIHI